MNRQQHTCNICGCRQDNVEFARLSVTNCQYLCPTCLDIETDKIIAQSALEKLFNDLKK